MVNGEEQVDLKWLRFFCVSVYFIAHDFFLSHASLMPVRLAQMNALKNDDPVTWEALKSGDFVVAKLDVAFTCFSQIIHTSRKYCVKRRVNGTKCILSVSSLCLDKSANRIRCIFSRMFV